MYKLLAQIAAGILGFWLADRYVSGVEFTGEIKTLLIAGCVLGLINFFIKPVLKLITLPLRILTFGLFSLVINVLIVWAVNAIFSELSISGIQPLLWTTLIIWVLSLFLGMLKPRKK